MTACTNNGGSRARRAVTAALVGVLSVGAAPMVALATTGTGDVSLLATNEADINKGTVQYSTGEPGDTFTYNGEEQGIVPSTLTTVGGEALDLTLAPSDRATRKDGNYYYYVEIDDSASPAAEGKVSYVNADGKTVVLNGETMFEMPTDAGEYAVVVGTFTQAGGWTYVSVADTFTITGRSLDDVVLYERDDDDLDDVSDTTFAYTGMAGCDEVSNVVAGMGLALDGEPLEVSDFSIKVYEKDGDAAITSGSYLVPGTEYVALITPNVGANFTTKTVQKAFTYEKLDLSEAEIVAVGAGTQKPSVSNLSSIVESVGDVQASALAHVDNLSVAMTGSPEGSLVVDPRGEYEFTITADADSAYYTGSAKVTYVYADDVATVSYDGTAPTETDLSDDEPTYFDLDKVKVEAGGKQISEGYTVTVLDKDGNEVSNDSLTQPGKWTVEVIVNATVNGKVYAAAHRWTVDVFKANVDEATDVFLTLDGENVESSKTVKYDGTDWADKMGVRVLSGEEDLVEGTDYELVVTKGGEEVDSIVDKGTYKVTVKPITFKMNGDGEFTIVVEAVELNSENTRVSFPTSITYTETYLDGTVYKTRDVTFVPYTGEEIVPVVEVALTTDEDGEPVWTALDSSLYELSYKTGKVDGGSWKPGSDWLEAMVEKGNYRVTVEIDSEATENLYGSVADDNDGKGFVVADTKVFVDVPNTAYYAQPIYTAVNQGYIVGLGGSNMFGPDQSISRADMVCVLYRMAGGSVDSEGVSNADQAYITDFEDVDPNAYYAKAVAWAVKAGVANGYGDTFGTERAVSTEEFVTMLARYAAICGTDTSVDDVDAVLAGTPDGDQVSGYAREAMAWAVESEYVGKDGNSLVPQGSVSRGRAVTIAVRYQPAQNDVVSRL